MKLNAKLFFWLATLFMVARATLLPAQSDFYKGKTITVYVGTTPGALYDQWGRILAQHMGETYPRQA